MGPVHSPAAVSKQKHSQQEENTQSNRTHKNFSLVAPWSVRPSPNSPGHSLIGTEGVFFCGFTFPFLVLSLPLVLLCFGSSCPFLVSCASVSLLFFLVFLSLASVSSGRLLVRVVRALALPLVPSLSLFLVPFGYCA